MDRLCNTLHETHIVDEIMHIIDSTHTIRPGEPLKNPLSPTSHGIGTLAAKIKNKNKNKKKAPRTVDCETPQLLPVCN